MSLWALIANEDGATRSRCLWAVVGLLQGAGLLVGGFVQQRSEDAAGVRRTHLERLSTGERVLLATMDPARKVPDDPAATCHEFTVDGFATALRWVREDAVHCAVLVVDSASRLEAHGQGHARVIREVLVMPGNRVLVLGARASVVFDLCMAFGLPELEGDLAGHLDGPCDDGAPRRFADELLAALRAA